VCRNSLSLSPFAEYCIPSESLADWSCIEAPGRPGRPQSHSLDFSTITSLLASTTALSFKLRVSSTQNPTRKRQSQRFEARRAPAKVTTTLSLPSSFQPHHICQLECKVHDSKKSISVTLNFTATSLSNAHTDILHQLTSACYVEPSDECLQRLLPLS
jgi:hypothetical protein